MCSIYFRVRGSIFILFFFVHNGTVLVVGILLIPTRSDTYTRTYITTCLYALWRVKCVLRIYGNIFIHLCTYTHQLSFDWSDVDCINGSTTSKMERIKPDPK